MVQLLLLPLLLALVKQSLGDQNNGSSKFTIAIPKSLDKEGGYKHREAMFGVPQYGGSISQNVYYAKSDFCNPFEDSSRWLPPQKKGEPPKAPFILMVDKGGCSFVSKVRNAQHAGASGALIANTHCICSDSECPRDTSYCDTEEPSMADDGSGSDISIPAFLIFKQDADKIKGVLQRNQPVVVEMGWHLPTAGDRVKYEFWTVPTDEISKQFFLDFEYAVALGLTSAEGVDFEPHVYLQDSLSKSCQYNQYGERWCETGCTNGGRYCALDPDHDVTQGLSGGDVVKEGLRRMCIWNSYKHSASSGLEYWKYLSQFTSHCEAVDHFTDDSCINACYKAAGIDRQRVDACMTSSGGIDKDSPNAILDQQVKSSEGIVVFPTSKVNGVELRGSLTAGNVVSAICAAFDEKHQPLICEKCGKCSDMQECIDLGGFCSRAVPTKRGGVSAGTFVFSLLVVVGISAGAGFYYYRKTRAEMRDRVRDILAEYMPLEDQEGESSAMNFARTASGGNE